ncbi:two-component nodulation response regulator protein [Pandoraea aquatica]|uniref:Two-component nodulation response regulator protein n=1 Tax=Pandoraea aquatica TaxID=2508290 RepID=A0A5E4UTD4_9BURK|nr:LuxR C-terminal-related transcriptional regulator [Pandoraea aquatica]VVE01710.1 two-component nodulation response regulator protein [Pandoraea aquatica]
MNALPDSDIATVYVLAQDLAENDTLCAQLTDAGLRARGLTSAAAFLASERSVGPACLVLDADLGAPSGGLLLQDALIDLQDPIPVVLITDRADVTTSVRGMKAGAVDYLTKPMPEGVLLSAVGAALALDRQRLGRERASTDVIERAQRLSQREREVMALVAAGRMNKHIADELGISEVTVKIHRGNAMRKMEARSFADLVIMAHKLGMTSPALYHGGIGRNRRELA